MSVSSVSLSESIANDPILSKMEDPNILWGDLFREELTTSSSPDSLIRPKFSRTTIQKKYPVIVRKTPGTKTLGIQWRMQKLAEWRAVHPNPWDWKPYEVKIAREMILELKNAGWNVYAPTHPSFVCSISPNGGGRSDATVVSWEYEEPKCPTLLCLNDIKLFFPVIWHKLDKEPNCKKYSIELYHDKIRTTALSYGVRSELLTNYLSSLLPHALAQSPAWNVFQSCMAGELCRLVIM